VRAARALGGAPVGAAAPCDPGGGELPLFAQDLACKYTVTCAGAKGRNLFDEPGTTVISAEIAARCKRVLRVMSLDEPSSGAPPLLATGRFTGTSSQGKPVGFSVRAGLVRDLDVSVHFQCTDNTSQFANSILSPKPSAQEAGLLGSLGLQVLDRRVNGDETIGPFPPLTANAHGFQASLEAPNASAIYDVQGTLQNGTWAGSVRIVEGWHASPLGLIPAPDGEVVCDTGPVTFTAHASR
jgi:hypothetical protein